jgi:predicted amidohydrolase YtcJ
MKNLFLTLGFLLSLSLFATAQTADLALINGRIWTGLKDQPDAEAIAMRGTTILRTGSTAAIKKLINDKTQVIDLGGKLVLAGFNDSHIHFLGGSQGLTRVDLTDAKTMDEMRRRITTFAKENPQAAWITGRGWEYGWFAAKLPHRRELDAIVADRPVFLSAYDGHSGWANSKALQLAGVTRETKFEGFGEIVRDAQGELTGALLEGAQSLVRRLIPETTRAQNLDALRRGLKLAASLGLTSWQNASGGPDEFSLYEELMQRGELTARVGIALSVGQQITQAHLDEWLKLRDQYAAHQQLRASAVKFMLDGVIESHTAAMLEPYSDGATTKGEPAWPLALYREKVALCDKRGLQIYTHAIGDRAVREALNAYEQAAQKNGRRDARHRIEHIETVSPADLPRFAKLGVLASMQPIHADPGTTDVWEKAVGSERVQRAFAWRELQTNKAQVVLGSDWPACISVSPMRGIHNAVNRRTTDGKPPAGWIPQQRLTLAAALRAYTQGSAYGSKQEQIKGTLAPGKLADVIVLSQDLFNIEPQRIHATRVVLTIFDGKVIYREP